MTRLRGATTAQRLDGIPLLRARLLLRGIACRDKCFSLADVPGRTDRPVEGECLIELFARFAVASLCDERFGRTQPDAGGRGHSPHLREYICCLHESPLDDRLSGDVWWATA